MRGATTDSLAWMCLQGRVCWARDLEGTRGPDYPLCCCSWTSYADLRWDLRPQPGIAVTSHGTEWVMSVLLGKVRLAWMWPVAPTAL